MSLTQKTELQSQLMQLLKITMLYTIDVVRFSQTIAQPVAATFEYLLLLCQQTLASQRFGGERGKDTTVCVLTQPQINIYGCASALCCQATAACCYQDVRGLKNAGGSFNRPQLEREASMMQPCPSKARLKPVVMFQTHQYGNVDDHSMVFTYKSMKTEPHCLTIFGSRFDHIW